VTDSAGEVAGCGRACLLHGIIMDVVSNCLGRSPFELKSTKPDVMFGWKFGNRIVAIGAFDQDIAAPVVQMFPRRIAIELCSAKRVAAYAVGGDRYAPRAPGRCSQATMATNV
jgi:hypothetical protein